MEAMHIRCGLAAVTEKGILFNGNHYSNASLLRSQLFAYAETQGYWHIPVLYDINESRHIILWGSDHLELAYTVEHEKEIDTIVIQKYQEEIQKLKRLNPLIVDTAPLIKKIA